MSGELLVRWTIRLSLLCYALVLLGQLWFAARQPSWSAQPKRTNTLGRALWTLGALLAVVHVLSAFHVYHHWSHADAVAATARETQEVVGIAVGLGVYFNYLFVLLWLADVGLWWKLGAAYNERPRWWAWLVHGYLLFIAINGAIVFESGPTRWGGIVACVLLAILGVKYFLRSPHPRTEIQA